MKAPPEAIVLAIDPSRTAAQIAAALLGAARNHYGETLDIDGIQAAMDEIWFGIFDDFSPEQRQRLNDITHVSLPMNDLGASITMPPSQQGRFIIFDAVLDIRLAEIFTAPRNVASWAACYLRAAFASNFKIATWAVEKIEQNQNLGKQAGKVLLPDSYSLQAARDFIYAHECGHFFLGHLEGHSVAQRHFGGTPLAVFDPALEQELDADRFARDALCYRLPRLEGLPLWLQQMGVDWLFGFLGAVLGMRERAQARRDGRPVSPAVHAGIARRREAAWNDYLRRIEISPHDSDRLPEKAETVQRVRMNVDNFNQDLPGALADIYAAAPAEVMAWQERIIETPIADGQGQEQLSELARIGAGPTARLPPVKWRHRAMEWLRSKF